MSKRRFIKDNIELLTLLLILTLFLWKSYPLSNSLAPLNSSDYSAHIFKIWHVSEKGLTVWNNYWYGGFPFLKYYPPLSYLIGASMTGAGPYLAYNLLMDIAWLLIPVAFFIFLKTFSFSPVQRSAALLIFSFSPATLVFFKNSNLPFIVSFLFALVSLVYFKKSLSGKSSAAKPIILLTTVLLTHVLMALFLFISITIWFISRFNTKALKAFIPIVLIPSIVASFWYFPFSQGVYSGREGGVSVLPDPVSYTAFTTNQRLGTIGIPVYLFAAFGLFLFLSIAASLRKFKDRLFIEFFPWLLISFLLFMVLDYKRIVILMIIPISILVSYNCKKKLLYFLTLPLVLASIAMFSFLSMSFTQIPYYPEAGNRVMFFDEEKTCQGCSLYSVFLPPIKGNEVINGWLPQSQNTNDLFEKRGPFLKKIQDPLSVSYSEFNELAKAGMVNYIVVSKNSPSIADYFSKNPAFSQIKEENSFLVYKSIELFPYIEINGQAVNSIVTKNRNEVKAEFACKPGILTVKETYDKGWKITINKIPANPKPNKYGFMEIESTIGGQCALEMVYSRPIF